jgi:AraC-like DNA-binding protein
MNDTCGCAASSHPASDSSRAKVATVGDFRPCS